MVVQLSAICCLTKNELKELGAERKLNELIIITPRFFGFAVFRYQFKFKSHSFFNKKQQLI